MLHKLRSFSLAIIMMLASAPALAAERQALPIQSVIAVLADGASWAANAPNGRSFDLTLNKDGTGEIDGAFLWTLSLTWEVKNEALCISNTMMSKCLQFSETPGGFQGWKEGKPDLRLSRPVQ